MRVSIVNPKKKGKKGKKGKPWEKGLRAARKARKAKAKGGKKASTRKSRPKKKKAKRGKKRSKKTKKSKPKRKKARKARKSSKRKGGKKRKSKKGRKSKPWAKGLRAARKALKGKRRKKSKRGRKVRPVMYRGRSKKGKMVLRHSPKSRYARKGYRFNPIGKYVPGARKHMVSMKDPKLNLPTAIGGVGGFVTSGLGGGMARVQAQKYTSNELIVGGVSLLGNYVGTEVPAMVVHMALGKAKVSPKTKDGVCKGMRIGGYVAMALNGATIALKALNVNLPFRALGETSGYGDLILSGVGDVDLALAGLGDIVQGNDFVATDEYAGLGEDEGLLDAEIAALSAYMGEDMDEFGDTVSDDSGLSM